MAEDSSGDVGLGKEAQLPTRRARRVYQASIPSLAVVTINLSMYNLTMDHLVMHELVMINLIRST
jgi:hypothetical protein